MSTANLPPVRTSQLVKMPLTHSVLHPGQPWDQHATYLSLWSSNWWKKTKAIKNPLGTTPTVAQSVLHLIPRRKKNCHPLWLMCPNQKDCEKHKISAPSIEINFCVSTSWNICSPSSTCFFRSYLTTTMTQLSDNSFRVGPVPRPKVSLLRVHQVVPPAPRILSMPGTPLDVTVGGPCQGLLAWRIRRLWLVRASLLLSLGCWQFMTSVQHGWYVLICDIHEMLVAAPNFDIWIALRTSPLGKPMEPKCQTNQRPGTKDHSAVDTLLWHRVYRQHTRL